MKAILGAFVRIQRLAEEGHALRRPEADYLRDGIHELRARQGHVNYRILYFFHDQTAVILAHGLTKESEVPGADIERARRRKAAFEEHPERHLYEGSDGEEGS
jgi:phage-related protein